MSKSKTDVGEPVFKSDTSWCIVLGVAATSEAGVVPQYMSQPGVLRLQLLKDVREYSAYYYRIFKSEILRKFPRYISSISPN